MKKRECAYTKKALPEYLRGHVFRSQKKRIEAHLRSCVVCHSEYAALRHKEDTRQILKDIESPEGVSHRIRDGFFMLARFKKLLYRPLWVAGAAIAAAGIYYFAMLPPQVDQEIESIVATSPATTVPVPTAPAAALDAGAEHKAIIPPSQPAQPVEPFVVLITPENEGAAINQINEVMRGHAQLRTMKFSDTVREISGVLTGGELTTLFYRISPMAKTTYNRKRFESFPAAHQIPFVLRLNTAAPRTAVPAPISQPASTPAAREDDDADEEPANPQEPAPPATHAR